MVSESVVLQMIDVNKVEWHSHHAFLDTGSPHHVALVKDIDTFNVVEEGKKIRYGAPYFEEVPMSILQNKYKIIFSKYVLTKEA